MKSKQFNTHKSVLQVGMLGNALSDPNRIKALRLLACGEQCVCTITDTLGLAASTVSKHMQILKKAGLVKSRRSGKWTYYSLEEVRENDVIKKVHIELLNLLPSVVATCKTPCEQTKKDTKK